jgi:hypothetical protein
LSLLLKDNRGRLVIIFPGEPLVDTSYPNYKRGSPYQIHPANLKSGMEQSGFVTIRLDALKSKESSIKRRRGKEWICIFEKRQESL